MSAPINMARFGSLDKAQEVVECSGHDIEILRAALMNAIIHIQGLERRIERMEKR